MGIKVLGAILLGVFTAGSAISGVSSALGDNQTVANVSENFDSKSNDKKNGNDRKEDSSKGLVFCESSESNSNNLKRDLALGGVGVACLAGGVALGIKANSKSKEEEEVQASVVSEDVRSEYNRGKMGNSQGYNNSADKTASKKGANVEEKSETSSGDSDVFAEFVFFLLATVLVAFFGTCGCFCCCGHPELLCAVATHAINSGNTMPIF